MSSMAGMSLTARSITLREAQRGSTMPHSGQTGIVKNVRDEPAMPAKYCFGTKLILQPQSGSSAEVKIVDRAEIRLDLPVLDIFVISTLSSIRIARTILRAAMKHVYRYHWDRVSSQ